MGVCVCVCLVLRWWKLCDKTKTAIGFFFSFFYQRVCEKFPTVIKETVLTTVSIIVGCDCYQNSVVNDNNFENSCNLAWALKVTIQDINESYFLGSCIKKYKIVLVLEYIFKYVFATVGLIKLRPLL